jgi:Protein of unknown function (DUF3040)
MPLSEDDQRKLDQIEQALTKDDPRFAETVNIDRWRRRRIVLACASFTIGMVVLIVGLVITQAVLVLTGLRPSPTRHDVCNCRFKGKLTQGPAVSVADRHHSLRRGIMTMTRSAYVQVRCAVVALWSERHQRYAAKTGPETSNLTQNYGFAGSSFLGPPVRHH